jgi:uncharacterized repeat protein (TIGR01451 family)
LPDAVPGSGSQGAPEITPPSTLPVSPFKDYPDERYRNLCQYVNVVGENGLLDQTYLRTLGTFNDDTEFPSDHCQPLENAVHDHSTHVNPTQHPCGMTCVFAIVADVNGDDLTGGFEFPTTLYGHGNYYAAIHVPDASSGGSLITLPDGRSVANILPDGLVPGSIIDTREKLDAYNATLLYFANAGVLPIQTNSALVFPDEELVHEKLQTSDLYLIAFAGGGPTAIKADVTLDQGDEGIDFDGDGKFDDGVPGDIVVGGGLGRVHKLILVDGDWKDNTASGYLWLTGVTGTFTPETGLFVDGAQRATVTAVGQALPIIWEAPDDPDVEKTTHDCRHLGPDRCTISRGGTVQLEARVSDGSTEEQNDFHWVSYPDSFASIEVEKTASPTVVESGGQVTYRVTITNTSTVETVTITQVFDVVVGGDLSESCSPSIPARLRPAQSVTCTVRTAVTGEPGTYIKNIAVVWGYDDDGNPLGGDGKAMVRIKDENCEVDVDGDGHYAEGSCASPADDCNDNDNTVYPGADEICDDGIDNDCDDDTDCDDVDCENDQPCACTDVDGDDYYAEAACPSDTDCDDTDANIHPGADEICDDGIDNDCDDDTDCDDVDCENDQPCACTDMDGDNYYAEAACPGDTDCDDTDAKMHPGAMEICDDEIDNDCDDDTDCDDGDCDNDDACPQPVGACCSDEGNCSQKTQNECIQGGGTYEGNGLVCDPNPCSKYTGACCGALGVCYVTGQESCVAAGDTFKGTGTTCTPGLCPEPEPEPDEWVVFTIDNAKCFDAIIITVRKRIDFNKDEKVCEYWYYGENTCTDIASKNEVQGNFVTQEAAYEWIDQRKGEWMLNRWCPGNGYHKIPGIPGSEYFMIF